MDPSSIHQYGSCISTPLYLENTHHHQHHLHNPTLFIPSVVPSHSIPQLPATVPRTTSYSTTRRVLEETSHNSTIQTPASTGSHPATASPQHSGKIHAKLEQKRRSRGARIHGTVAAPSAKTLAAAVQQNDLVPYHQYRARQRRDASMDGESVWDEELEEAFMEGRSY